MVALATGRGARAQEGLPVALDFTPLGAPVAGAAAGSAPADENFGPYPMSVIGIENTIRRADANVESFARGTSVAAGPIGFTVPAIRDWERRFPHDPWLPRELAELVRFYEHVGTATASEDAHRAIAWIEADFAASPQAVALRSYVDGRPHDEPPPATPAAAHVEAPAVHPSATPFDVWSRFSPRPSRT